MSRRMPRHLISIGDLDRAAMERILDRAESFAEVSGREIKKVPALRGRTVVNLFYEASTRTSSSFELAAKRLSADVVSIRSVGSSVDKGESLKDTVQTLSAYDPAAIVIRSPHVGAAQLVAGWTSASVINAGDGKHEHPTQALLDALTIRRRRGSLQGLLVAICGDIMHSRVARSNIHLLQIMGARVRVVGPPTLMPTDIEKMGVEVHYSMKTGLKDVDIVMMLRLQTERMQGLFVPSISEYFHFFGLDHEKLKFAKPDALIMHPGPMNRGVEIDSEVADDLDRSVIHEQVEMGVAVRMACLEALIGGRRNALAGAAA
jgi:aspartate carbamoyltransferase catalytic subunit